MAIPVLKGSEDVDNFSKQMRVYAKRHGFETVFKSDPYVAVGADESDCASMMAQRITASMYERLLMAWVFFFQALQSNVDEASFHRSTSPSKCWVSINSGLVRYENQCTEGNLHEAAVYLSNREGGRPRRKTVLDGRPTCKTEQHRHGCG